MMKKIGILTSGGDCAGLNAAIRSVVLHASNHYGCQVYGIENGTHGLIKRPVLAKKLNPQDMNDDLLRKGGTFLGTINKGNPFHYPIGDGMYRDITSIVIEGFHELGLEGLIGIGGDGSIGILRRISRLGNIPFVAIPKTIDDDIGGTEHAIGFLSALDVATQAIDRLHPTAASHDRVMILEVMGRDAGHIALSAGIAGGADVILIPEIACKMDLIAQHLKKIMVGDKKSALIVVAEAISMESGRKATVRNELGHVTRYAGIGDQLSKELESRIDAEIRVTVLGHVQRGGQPCAQDRIWASAFGVHGVDVLMSGKSDRLIAWRNGRVLDVSIDEGIGVYKSVDVQGSLVKTARALGVSFGDV